jgi:membrane-associated phospholipid phosphatase
VNHSVAADIICRDVDQKLLGTRNVRKNEWIRWPTKDIWRAFLRSAGWLSVEWAVVYGGADWITSLHNYRFSLKTGLDFRLPFVPSAAVVYLSLFPMLWLAPFIFNSPARLRAFAHTLGIVIAVSGISFLLLPIEAINIHMPERALPVVFRFADWINLTYNDFPSLHVSMTVVCAIFYSRSSPMPIGILFWLWATMIALATLLTRQHYIADVLAGGLLGTLVGVPLASRVMNSRET